MTAGWPWGPGSSRAVTVTGPTGLRAQRALCTVQPQPGVLRSGCRCGLCCTVYNGPLCLCPFCILHASSGRSEVQLARAVCLPPSQGHEVLLRPAGFSSRRAVRGALPNRRRSSETIGVPHRSARWTGAGRIGARGSRSSHFWPGVCSAGPWLGGSRASRKAQRGTRTARGATDILQSASLPASAGPAVLVQPESVRAELRAGSLAVVVSGRGGRVAVAAGILGLPSSNQRCI